MLDYLANLANLFPFYFGWSIYDIVNKTVSKTFFRNLILLFVCLPILIYQEFQVCQSYLEFETKTEILFDDVRNGMAPPFGFSVVESPFTMFSAKPSFENWLKKSPSLEDVVYMNSNSNSNSNLNSTKVFVNELKSYFFRKQFLFVSPKPSFKVDLNFFDNPSNFLMNLGLDALDQNLENQLKVQMSKRNRYRISANFVKFLYLPPPYETECQKSRNLLLLKPTMQLDNCVWQFLFDVFNCSSPKNQVYLNAKTKTKQQTECNDEILQEFLFDFETAIERIGNLIKASLIFLIKINFNNVKQLFY